MARDFKQTKKLESISDLNVTPLIDLAFALLIIFMITTPVIEQYNRIELPDQSTSDQQPKKQLEDKTITIDANGVYQWGEDDVTKERLEALLDEIAEAPPLDQPVVHIIDVVDMLKSRNLTKLSLDGKGG
jgi:biopolymer transport protein ExbD